MTDTISTINVNDLIAECDAAIVRAGKVTRSQFETIQSIVNYHTDIHDDNVLVDTARDIIEALGLEVEE